MSIGIIEGKIVRAHIKEREEAEKAGKVIIDAAPSRRRKGGSAIATSSDASESPGCLGGFFANIQKRVEDINREAQKRGK